MFKSYLHGGLLLLGFSVLMLLPLGLFVGNYFSAGWRLDQQVNQQVKQVAFQQHYQRYFHGRKVQQVDELSDPQGAVGHQVDYYTGRINGVWYNFNIKRVPGWHHLDALATYKIVGMSKYD